jgi:hypothetical protein
MRKNRDQGSDSRQQLGNLMTVGLCSVHMTILDYLEPLTRQSGPTKYPFEDSSWARLVTAYFLPSFHSASRAIMIVCDADGEKARIWPYCLIAGRRVKEVYTMESHGRL